MQAGAERRDKNQKELKMKFRLIALLLLLFTSGMASAQTGTVEKTIYSCPMHPQIQRSRPGDCPICGMTLVKKTIRVKAAVPKPKPKSKPMSPAPVLKHEKEATQEKTNAAPDQPLRDVTERLEDAVTATPAMGTIKAGPPKRVHYDLYVKDTLVNYTGGKKMRHAIAINGSIPAPTLYFNKGDTAEIFVHNLTDGETSIHWHGVILPNTEDGVSYLTTAPIKAGETHRFFFPIVQNGTYWYHSHTKTQEQDGMYGALVFYKRAEPAYKQLPIVLSEWTDMKSHEVDRSLHNQTDWFSIRKGSVQSYAEAIQQGHFKTKVNNEWKRMLAMDVSDVYYDRFLINGQPDNEQPQFKPGDKVKLRVVNGGSSSYFWLTWAGGKMTVVANDGEDVVPVEVDRLIIAVAETYDTIVTIPDNHSYEFLATPEDRTKSASLWLGNGSKVIAPHLPKLKYFEGMKMMNGMMKMNGDMTGMEGMKMSNQMMDMNTVMYPEITGGGDGKYGNTVTEGAEEESESGDENDQPDSRAAHSMDMKPDSSESMANMPMKGGYVNGKWQDMNSGNSGIKTLNYTMLRAPKKTNLPGNWPSRTFYFELTGNMNRYVWTINNKATYEVENITIGKGENIRMVLFNNTMMRHPMHLHGHFFRVLNGQGDYSPLKTTLDIMPMETDTIEFAATETGDWFFHCHILYHMMAGMGRVFHYQDSPPNPQLPDARYANKKFREDGKEFHPMAEIGLETNGSDGMAMLANIRWQLETMWHLGMHQEHGYESETMLGRYFGKMQWWFPYVGFDYHYKRINADGEHGSGLIGKNIFGDEEHNMFGQESNKPNRKTVMAGVRYTLPMLILADFRVDGNGKFRFQLSREDVPVTSRLRFNFMLNTDKEYMAGFRYVLTKYISLSSHYDSDMGLGAGITLTY